MTRLFFRKSDPRRPVDPDAYEGEELHFLDHLEELRIRLIRSIAYVLVAALICVGFAGNALIELVMEPALKAFEGINSNFIFTKPMDPMMTWLKIGLISGVIVAIPFIALEAWGFVAPALTVRERRAGYVVMLICPFLFLCGVVFIYFVIPLALKFLFQFASLFPNTVLMPEPGVYLGMLLTLMLAMGVVFQMPVVVGVLARLGIVTGEGLLRFWRHAVLGCVALAAVITPTWDPVNLSIVAGPMVGLYFVSIGVAALVEKGLRRLDAERDSRWEAEDQAAGVVDPGDPEGDPPALASAEEPEGEDDAADANPAEAPSGEEEPTTEPTSTGFAPSPADEGRADNRTGMSLPYPEWDNNREGLGAATLGSPDSATAEPEDAKPEPVDGYIDIAPRPRNGDPSDDDAPPPD